MLQRKSGASGTSVLHASSVLFHGPSRTTDDGMFYLEDDYLSLCSRGKGYEAFENRRRRLSGNRLVVAVTMRAVLRKTLIG